MNLWELFKEPKSSKYQGLSLCGLYHLIFQMLNLVPYLGCAPENLAPVFRVCPWEPAWFGKLHDRVSGKQPEEHMSSMCPRPPELNKLPHAILFLDRLARRKPEPDCSKQFHLFLSPEFLCNRWYLVFDALCMTYKEIPGALSKGIDF